MALHPMTRKHATRRIFQSMICYLFRFMDHTQTPSPQAL